VSSTTKKPFFFQPPWNILFELHRLQKKLMPWDVNISFLLTSFLKEMEKRGETDFRASGIALDSSTTIYLMKSKLLLKLEEPPPPPEAPPEFLPPPLFLPIRYELSSTTINHLLQVLDEVLLGERPLRPEQTRLEPPLPPPAFLPPIDLYLVEIEERMKNLYELLSRLARESKVIVFSKIIAKSKKLEAVKTFIILLFLAHRGKASLWQEDAFGELYITLTGVPTVGAEETRIFGEPREA
jgi:chromatin segregation and condensation protein Rec8/ScpA/Scc1 (kleisin family)